MDFLSCKNIFMIKSYIYIFCWITSRYNFIGLKGNSCARMRQLNRMHKLKTKASTRIEVWVQIKVSKNIITKSHKVKNQVPMRCYYYTWLIQLCSDVQVFLLLPNTLLSELARRRAEGTHSKGRCKRMKERDKACLRRGVKARSTVIHKVLWASAPRL